MHFSLEQVADDQCLFEETIEMGGGITEYLAKKSPFSHVTENLLKCNLLVTYLAGQTERVALRYKIRTR